MVFSSLPIEEIRGELMEALRVPSPRILLKAPTGSGKSTGVPPMMDDAGLGDRGLIVVVQPRRMAARLLARHVARLRGVELGKEVGYAVRFERYISSRTRIAYVTDGMLERWLTEWPSLEGVSAVVFDEFHERSLSGDLSLGRVLDLQEGPRRDLAVVVMSVQLRLPNNTMVRIPNEIIIKNPVSNITRFSTRRCDLSLGVDYNCDIEHVVNVLREVVKQNKFCLDDPAPLISFSGFQDSSLGFTVGAWCRKDNFLDCQKTLAHDIKRRFEEEGISFPFPTRSLESRSPIKVEISGPPEKNQ